MRLLALNHRGDTVLRRLTAKNAFLRGPGIRLEVIGHDLRHGGDRDDVTGVTGGVRNDATGQVDDLYEGGGIEIKVPKPCAESVLQIVTDMFGQGSPALLVGLSELEPILRGPTSS